MSPDERELLQKAGDSLAAASILLEQGYPDFAASRAYYAMFYVAQALLEREGRSFSKHSAVIAAFGRDFAHAGRVPEHLHRHLLEAQEVRHAGDYGSPRSVTEDRAREVLDRAAEFLETGRGLLEP